MYAPQFTAKNELSGYGLGIYNAIQHSSARLSHGGFGYGISAHYRFLPEHQIGIVLLTNQDAAHNAPDLASRVIELMLAAKPGALPKIKFVSSNKPVVFLDESTLRRFEGTYLLYEGVLFRFKYERGTLFQIVGREKLKLDAHSANEFSSGSRSYKFSLSENGKTKGVQIADSYYDPQTTENSMIYLPVNDAPADAKGLNKPEWSRRVSKYMGKFIGETSEVKVSLENGHLYLKGELKLAEIRPDFFMAADGEAVIFKEERLSVGNKLYIRKK